MALQSGAVAAAPEKLPATQWYNHGHHHHHQPPPHFQVDEREGFMMWLRGEFAAANAIIDAMCHHLRAVGDPGEYDGVIGSVQQRRCNWNPVLHMQQYFSVSEVVYALQQVGWRRQQQKTAAAGVGKDYRRGGRGHRGGFEVNGKDLNNGYAKSNGGDKPTVEEKEEKKDCIATRPGSTQGAVAHEDDKEEAAGSSDVDGSEFGSEDKRNLQVSPRSFVATETCEGKSVNIAEGMKLYENLFDDSEMSKLITLVNDLRASGRRGQLKGHSFVSLKRPMRGHGREIVQLGVPIADGRLDDEAAGGTYKDLNTEPIPELLEDVIERLLTEKVVSIKPDSAIIDFFNEGDHSQPHFWPHWFERPVIVLFLTECDMSFGKVITADHPGDYQGALKLSLSPGSMLVMQGRSADFARHAIPSLRKQRILVTLVKSQPKKVYPNEYHHRFPSLPPPSNWAPPPSRSPIHTRPVAAKHFGPIPPTGVLPVPPPRQPHPPPNGVQPIYVPNPVGPGIPFPTPTGLPPASAGWPPAGPPPRHPPPHLPVVPGTGVFLPSQGSGNSSSNEHASTSSAESNITTEMASGVEEETAVKKSDDDQVPDQECNGTTDAGTTIAEKEECENQDSTK